MESRFKPKEFSLDFLIPHMDIVQDILKEIQRANAKHGTPNHPLISDHTCPHMAHIYYNVPSERDAKAETDYKFGIGQCTHADIILEEFCEFISAETIEKQREELVQIAATVIKAIQNIDRNEAPH